jgi:hypothetical protein
MMQPSDDFERRLLALAEKRPSPTRSDLQGRLRWVAPLAAVAMGVVFFSFGGFRNATARESLAGFGMVGGCFVLAVIATVAALSRGRSMLGLSSRALWALALGVPVGLAIWTMAFHLVQEDPFVRFGTRCFGMTLLSAPWPFAAIVSSRRLLDPVHPRLTGAAVGSVAGAWAAVMVTLWCPLAAWDHVLRGHLLPFAVLVPMGALLGRKLFGQK